MVVLSKKWYSPNVDLNKSNSHMILQINQYLNYQPYSHLLNGLQYIYSLLFTIGIEMLVHEALKAYLPQPIWMPKLMHPSNSKRKFASYINHHTWWVTSLFDIRRIGRTGKKKHLRMKLLDISSKHKVMGYSLLAIVKLW